MTYNPIDENTVRYESRTQPLAVNFVHHQPDEVIVNTAGSASVDFNQRGGEPDITSDANDAVAFKSFNLQRAGGTELLKTTFQFWFDDGLSNLSALDDCRMGVVGNDIGSGDPIGAYIDFKNAQYAVSNTDGTILDTAAFENMPTGNNEHVVLEIEHDRINDETRFIKRGSVGDSGAVTIDRTYPTGPNMGSFYNIEGAGTAESPPAIVAKAVSFR